MMRAFLLAVVRAVVHRQLDYPDRLAQRLVIACVLLRLLLVRLDRLGSDPIG